MPPRPPLPAPLPPPPPPRTAPILALPHPGLPPPRTDRDGRVLPDRTQMDRWVVRLRERDAGALREVVEAFGERITAVVAGVLRDRDAVDDVVQETFVKAYTRIDAFKGDAGLFTWLYRIAVNTAKDHAKARGRRPAASLDELPSGAVGLAATEAAPTVERLEDREQRLLVRRAVAALPAVFRSVLVLREIEGLRYEEIAQILDLSLGTVESRLFRARRRLKALLEQLGASA